MIETTPLNEIFKTAFMLSQAISDFGYHQRILTEWGTLNHPLKEVVLRAMYQGMHTKDVRNVTAGELV